MRSAVSSCLLAGAPTACLHSVRLCIECMCASTGRARCRWSPLAAARRPPPAPHRRCRPVLFPAAAAAAAAPMQRALCRMSSSRLACVLQRPAAAAAGARRLPRLSCGAADGDGAGGSGGADELPEALRGLEISADGKELIGACGRGEGASQCGAVRARPTQPAQSSPSRDPLWPSFQFANLPADTATGKVVNEFGATRFDVAVQGAPGAAAVPARRAAPAGCMRLQLQADAAAMALPSSG